MEKTRKKRERISMNDDTVERVRLKQFIQKMLFVSTTARKFKPILQCAVFYFFLFFTSCLFASYLVFLSSFYVARIKVNELRKKQEIRSKQYNCR